MRTPHPASGPSRNLLANTLLAASVVSAVLLSLPLAADQPAPAVAEVSPLQARLNALQEITVTAENPLVAEAPANADVAAALADAETSERAAAAAAAQTDAE